MVSKEKIYISENQFSADIDKYDVLISALGYETRSIYIPQKISGQYRYGLCVAFSDRKVLRYLENEKIYYELGFERVVWGRVKALRDIIHNLKKISFESGYIRIAVDVSSMSRQMSSKLLYGIINKLSRYCELELTVLYAPAGYAEKADNSIVTKIGPVIDEYAGWTLYPEKPLVAIIALGYEYRQAIGALDYLDISDAWLFLPESDDDKDMMNRVKVENMDLIQMLGSDRLLSYRVSDTYNTLIKLRSLIEGLEKAGNRVVLITFGPKIITAIAVIVAELIRQNKKGYEIKSNDISIWRVTGDQDEDAKDRIPLGGIVGVRVHVSKKKKSNS